tara:strand:+ start:473 stop:715 length:243 start_codon:yes stop_codon:yes gene_type:complete
MTYISTSKFKRDFKMNVATKPSSTYIDDVNGLTNCVLTVYRAKGSFKVWGSKQQWSAYVYSDNGTLRVESGIERILRGAL